MKKCLVLSISAILLVFNVVGQSDDDTVNYTLIYDHGDYNYFGLGLSYDMSINDHNFTLAAFGIDALYAGKLFYASVASRFHVLENLTDFASKSHPNSVSIYEEEKSRDISFNGTYFFKRSKVKNELAITVKSSRTTDYVIFVPASQSINFGADIGLMFMSTYYNFGDATLSAIDNSGDEFNFSDITATYLTQKVLRLGVSRTKITDFKVKTDKYGTKSSNGYSKFYFHTLIGFDSELDNVLQTIENQMTGEEIYRELDINTNAEFLPVGAAIGFENGGLSKFTNVGYVIELGLMPGPKYNIADNVYLNFKVRVNFGKKF